MVCPLNTRLLLRSGGVFVGVVNIGLMLVVLVLVLVLGDVAMRGMSLGVAMLALTYLLLNLLLVWASLGGSRWLMLPWLLTNATIILAGLLLIIIDLGLRRIFRSPIYISWWVSLLADWTCVLLLFIQKSKKETTSPETEADEVNDPPQGVAPPPNIEVCSPSSESTLGLIHP